MSKQYEILYLPLFYKDLIKITKYIKESLKNPIAANSLIADTYYRIYIRNYTVFYTVKGNIMNIRRILYSRRNFEKFI